MAPRRVHLALLLPRLHGCLPTCARVATLRVRVRRGGCPNRAERPARPVRIPRAPRAQPAPLPPQTPLPRVRAHLLRCALEQHPPARSGARGPRLPGCAWPAVCSGGCKCRRRAAGFAIHCAHHGPKRLLDAWRVREGSGSGDHAHSTALYRRQPIRALLCWNRHQRRHAGSRSQSCTCGQRARLRRLSRLAACRCLPREHQPGGCSAAAERQGVPASRTPAGCWSAIIVYCTRRTESGAHLGASVC